MGGIFMYIWGARFPETALLVVERIPNISASMMHQVRDQLLQQGYSALWIGAFSGKPFKIYAIYAGLLHLSFPRFLWMGFWARLSRFALLGLLVGYSSRSLQRKISLRVKVTIWAIAWTLFYSWYFRAMPE
jgi:membrane protein YqaA with SNARE-associated domain